MNTKTTTLFLAAFLAMSAVPLANVVHAAAPLPVPMQIVGGQGGVYGWTAANDTTGLGFRSNTPYTCVEYLGNDTYFATLGWDC